MPANNNDHRCIQLGNNVRKIRNKFQWSQELLAEKTDVHVSYIGQIERGLRYPSLKLLFKIADALEVKINELFRGIDAK